MKGDYTITENIILSRKLSVLREVVKSRCEDACAADDLAVYCTLKAIMYRLEDCVSDLALLEDALKK